MHHNRLCNIILILNLFTKLICAKSEDIINTFGIEGNLKNLNLYNNQTYSKQRSNINSQQDELDKLNNSRDSKSNQPHSRKKRLIWITDDGRLALPPGTSLSISPSISLPFIRHPPEGFLSNLSIGFPLSIDFDKLGLTDNQNPLGDFPPLFARSLGKAAGNMLSSYIADYVNFRRMKRDLSNYQTSNFKTTFTSDNNISNEPPIPKQYKHAFHGGERVLLYGMVEDFLDTFGVDGKACMLRTICEIHSKSLTHFGLLGEVTKLFLTASKSPFSDHIREYVDAEQIGRGNISPGECFPYYKKCPKSLFKTFTHNNYHSKSNHQNREDKLNKNTIEEYTISNKEKKDSRTELSYEKKIKSKKIFSMKK